LQDGGQCEIWGSARGKVVTENRTANKDVCFRLWNPKLHYRVDTSKQN
jgi:hypothetical protein